MFIQINSKPINGYADKLNCVTEGFILSAQDNGLLSNYYESNIWHNCTNPKYRFCYQYIDTIDHLISGSANSLDYNNRVG